MEIEPNMTKRPIGVWVIVCFFSLAFCLAVPSTIYTINNNPEVLEQFSTFEIVLSFLSMVLILVAVVFLFMLRAASFWIFLGVTFISIVPLVIRLLSGQEIPNPENMGYQTKMFELIVWGTIVLYIWALKSKGILK
jgi:hypothetical protein